MTAKRDRWKSCHLHRSAEEQPACPKTMCGLHSPFIRLSEGQATHSLSHMDLTVLKQSAQWALDTIPKAIGVQKIPAVGRTDTASNELKLPLRSYCQTDTYSCGAIAGWSVLEFLHPDADFQGFYEDCSPCPENGTSTTRLIKALRKHGVTVSHRRDLDFDGIKKCLEQGRPVLLAVEEGAIFDEDAAHWLVLYGCGWRPNRVFLSGKTLPGFSRQEMTWQHFKKVWSEVGEGLVCSMSASKVRRKKQSR